MKNRTGIAGVGSRMLRHTAACIALEKGVRLDVVQAMLGHKSIVSTQRYARLSESTVKQEMGKAWRRNRSKDSSRAG